jgi:hypothetical protein
MNKLLALIFAASTLDATAGLAVAGPPADLGFEPNRMFFRFVAPSTGTVDFQVLPDNLHNPIVLPCDLQEFGGQADFKYIGAGPTVFPKFTEAFFNAQNNQSIVSSGCTGLLVLQNEWAYFHAMTAGSVQTDGYGTVSSTNQFCPWMFQPSDLPADTVVRIHLTIAPYDSDSSQANPVSDPDLSNNEHDIYVRRSCACP